MGEKEQSVLKNDGEDEEEEVGGLRQNKAPSRGSLLRHFLPLPPPPPHPSFQFIRERKLVKSCRGKLEGFAKYGNKEG